VTFANGAFVVVGDGKAAEGAIFTSSNGIAWSKQSSGTGFNLRRVAYGNGKFTIVGNNGLLLESSEGMTWYISATGCYTTNNLRGIIYGNATYVAVGNAGTILTSLDGSDWNCANSETTKNLHSVAYGHGTFLAVGNSGTIVQSESFWPGTLEVRGRPNREGFELSIIGEIGRSYHVQANNSLSTSNWVDLFTFQNIEGATTLFLDSNASLHSQRFYRLTSP
jgi:hypothetical protein